MRRVTLNPEEVVLFICMFQQTAVITWLKTAKVIGTSRTGN
jgi:hypothetical protein